MNDPRHPVASSPLPAGQSGAALDYHPPVAGPEPAPGRPTGAAHFLQGLTDLGLRYVFANMGTDHVSLIEEMARWRQELRPHPEVILCPHENVAVHMAAGYAAITGEGQGVLVHVDAGTANASMGAHNLQRARLPALLMAGKAPYTLRGELPGSRDNYVHFVQDPFDIGSLVRPYVKWEYNLSTAVVAREALRRAHSVMHSDPPGPVFMTLPREVLAEAPTVPAGQNFDALRFGPARLGGVDLSRAELIAERLLGALSPVLITSYAGRRAEAVSALEDLAQLCAIRVVDYMPSYLGMSRQSPCFAGFDPAAVLPGADVGLLVDIDVPWLPRFVSPDPQTWWAHIDVDPMKQDWPMWGFGTNLRMQADAASVLRQVAAIVRERADDNFRKRVAERLAGLEQAAEARRQGLAKAAQNPGRPGALSAAHVCAALGRVLNPEDVVINEAVRNSPAVLQQIPRSRALTLFGGAGGGLGYSGSMALGVKLAKPDVRVVHVLGDGAFHLGTPSSVYATSQRYGLPIFTVVLDNGGWQAVKEAVLRVYPDGASAESDEFQARLQGPVRQFEKVGEAFGAYGECLSDPAQVEQAIARCLKALDEGRSAVLNVQIGLQ
jgi:acetolactate synthase-1/2/3 large subunit